MLSNPKLANQIQKAKFYEFRRQLEYKSSFHGINFIVADQYFPSSKTCSKCGHIKSDLKLSDRIYRCEICGNVIDRDYQAAINLYNEGKRLLAK